MKVIFKNKWVDFESLKKQMVPTIVSGMDEVYDLNILPLGSKKFIIGPAKYLDIYEFLHKQTFGSDFDPILETEKMKALRYAVQFIKNDWDDAILKSKLKTKDGLPRESAEIFAIKKIMLENMLEQMCGILNHEEEYQKDCILREGET